jgi:hypothetical protein
MQRIIDVCDGWGEGRGILNFKASGPVERYTLGTLLPTRDRAWREAFFLEKVNLLFLVNAATAAFFLEKVNLLFLVKAATAGLLGGFMIPKSFVPFRSELRNWLFRGIRNASE